MSVRIPHTAAQLRRMLNLAQMVQSHALSFFYLSSPDLLLGMESDPATRNIFGVAAARPELGRGGHWPAPLWPAHHRVAGRPSASIPDGWFPAASPSRCPRPSATRFWPCFPRPTPTSAWRWPGTSRSPTASSRRSRSLPTFPSNYLGLINEDESIEFTDGTLRLIDPKGQTIEDGITGSQVYRGDWRGRRELQLHQVRLLQAARLSGGQLSRGPAGAPEHRQVHGHAAGRQGTGRVQADWPPDRLQSSFHYHHARLVEALYGIEKIEQILSDPAILDKHVRATAGVNRLEGAGQIEAPRGTLNHHYKVDENGKITWANLVIATGHNNNAMNKGVLQAAKALREGRQIHRRHSQPRRGCGAHLRSMPELLDARLRTDAADSHAGERRRRGCGSSRTLSTIGR